jgi:hypothetical protein
MAHVESVLISMEGVFHLQIPDQLDESSYPVLVDMEPQIDADARAMIYEVEQRFTSIA